MGPRQALGEARMMTAAAIVAGSALLAAGCADTGMPEAAHDTTTAVTTTTTSTEVCADSWAMPGLDHAKYRVIADGVSEISTATDKQSARRAVGKWLDLASTDAGVMSGVAQSLSGDSVAPSALKGADGCATPAAKDLKGRLEGILATADMKPSDVPANAINSGVENGQLVQAKQAGISGDRRAVEVLIHQGPERSKLVRWVLGRCGNVASEGPIQGMSKGKTDEMTPKIDKYVTPAGVPGQNHGSGTADHGPRGPGKGPILQDHSGQGSVKGEAPVTAPLERSTPTDPNSNTGLAPVTPGVEQGGNQAGGNGSPAVPAEGNPGQSGAGQGGHTNPSGV